MDEIIDDDSTEWVTDDLLGPAYEQLPLGDATLVRRVYQPFVPKGVVLHVHGYNDYFFQTHLADRFTEAGYAFYAVDLKAAGRSLREDQIPSMVTDLREQADGINAAVQYLRENHPDLPVILHAHSTGGLIGSLYSHAFRNETGVRAAPEIIVLNSPFLALPGGWAMRELVGPATMPIGQLNPEAIISPNKSHYSNAMWPRWKYDATLKRPEGLPLRAGWLRAVQQGHRRLQQGLDIQAPILVLTSDASGPDKEDNPLWEHTDTVLDVAAIQKAAPKLGAKVTVKQIPGAVHDLSLSAPEQREHYLQTMFDWLSGEIENV